MTTLRYGAKGAEVKYLQGLLGGLNPDGVFGKKTEAAVKGYQSSHGLTADGIVGPKTWAKLTAGEPALSDVVTPCDDLKQFASPHGIMIYGPDKSYSTYKSGGCGVTSFAIVQRAYKLVPAGETGTQTIQRLGKYAWQHGYRIKGNGTSSGLFKTNGCTYTSTSNRDKILGAIRAGKLVILHIKKGFPNSYQGSGHYIVAYGIRGDTVLLRDVGSSSASRQTAPAASITTGLKGAYIMEVKPT